MNIVFTKHASERLKDRSIAEDYIKRTIEHPDKKIHQDDNNWKFIKTIKGRKVHAVATYLEKEKKWLVISVWVRGEEDKLPIVWQLITLPFKLIFWVIKRLFR